MPDGLIPLLARTAGVAEIGLDQLYRAELHKVSGSGAEFTAGVVDRRTFSRFARPRRLVPLSPPDRGERRARAARRRCPARFRRSLPVRTDAMSVRRRRIGWVNLAPSAAVRCWGSVPPSSTRRRRVSDQVYVPPLQGRGRDSVTGTLPLPVLAAVGEPSDRGCSRVVPSLDAQTLTPVAMTATTATAAGVLFMFPPPWSCLPVNFTGGHGRGPRGGMAALGT